MDSLSTVFFTVVPVTHNGNYLKDSMDGLSVMEAFESGT